MITLFHKSIATGVAITLIGTAAFAASHAATNKAVQARHAQMQMVSYHTGVLGDIAKGDREFDAALVEASATNLMALATMQRAPIWIEGTEQGAVEGSRAKATIWQDQDGFAAKFVDLEYAAEQFLGASSAQDVGTRMGALGNSCKDCHESYRGPKN